MRLTHFQVHNFRSINDSGVIKVDKLTSLVGRNESGKSNLLLALASLNPAGKRQALSPVKDFPRARRLEECKPETQVVWTWWELTPEETAEIAAILKHGPEIKSVPVGRGYAPALWVALRPKPPVLDTNAVNSAVRRLDPLLQARVEALEEPHESNCTAAWNAFESATRAAGNPKQWGPEVMKASANLRKQLGAAGIMLDEAQDGILADVEAKASLIAGFDKAVEEARALIIKWLPTFVYVSDFPELYGHQNLDTFTRHRGQDPANKEREDNFEKLAKVADFDPQDLNAHRDDHERRGQILNRASALVTGEIRRLWKDRQLMIRFDLDGPHLSTLVSDPNALYPVEVNLDERSRGFRWFFAFYITFSADTQGGNAAGAVLLLDEPGLYLHAKSQEHLLKHFREDYDNQIIYTTHSPFMVPPDAVNIVRTVNIDPETGTTVTDTPTGDSRTLFPLQAALGYQLSQTLFVGHSNMVVEGVTDFWILSAVNAHLRSIGNPGLPDELTLTPAGGAGKVSYMAALLASEELNVMVLLDDDRAGREAQKELVTSKLLRDIAITFVTEAFDPPSAEADVEDLIDPAVYAALVRDTYKSELKGKKFTLNDNIPRIVKRYEEAFQQVGLTFNKTRPAREFMSRMGGDPSKTFTAVTKDRFERMFAVIRKKYEKVRDSEAFK